MYVGENSIRDDAEKIVKVSRDKSEESGEKYKHFSDFIVGVKQSSFFLNDYYFRLMGNGYTSYATSWMVNSYFSEFRLFRLLIS